MIIKVKDGFRVMCLHGSFEEQGMRQLGLTLTPKVEKRGGGAGDAASKPLTLSQGAKLSLLTSDGRIVAGANDPVAERCSYICKCATVATPLANV